MVEYSVLGVYVRSKIGGAYDSLILNFLENLQADFHSGVLIFTPAHTHGGPFLSTPSTICCQICC